MPFIRTWWGKHHKEKQLRAGAQLSPTPQEQLGAALEVNLAIARELKEKSNDIVIREFCLWDRPDFRAALVYIEGLADEDAVNDFLLKPLMYRNEAGHAARRVSRALVMDTCLPAGQVSVGATLADYLDAMFDGVVVLLVDGVQGAILVELRSGMGRSPGEPEMNRTISGAREGFVENIVPNMTMLRRKLHDARLCYKRSKIGRRSHTKITMAYVDDIADPTIVKAVEQRLASIDIDALTTIGQLVQFLEEAPSAVFPQVRLVERADVVAADLLEGRVAVLMDQSPLVILVPAVFPELFQSPDDYAEKAYLGTIKRVIRFACFILGILLPAVYIALMLYHQELIPLKLMLPMMRYRSEVPLSIVMEVLLVEGLLYLLSEASLRMPRQISSAIGLVGGVILGEALLSSKLATPATLIVVTAAVVAQYSMTNYFLTRMMMVLRVVGVLAAALLGLFGVSLLWMALLASLAGLKTYGVPYMAPFGTSQGGELGDTLVMRGVRSMKKRPSAVPTQDGVRQRTQGGRQDG